MSLIASQISCLSVGDKLNRNSSIYASRIFLWRVLVKRGPLSCLLQSKAETINKVSEASFPIVQILCYLWRKKHRGKSRFTWGDLVLIWVPLVLEFRVTFLFTVIICLNPNLNGTCPQYFSPLTFSAALVSLWCCDTWFCQYALWFCFFLLDFSSV